MGWIVSFQNSRVEGFSLSTTECDYQKVSPFKGGLS